MKGSNYQVLDSSGCVLLPIVDLWFVSGAGAGGTEVHTAQTQDDSNIFTVTFSSHCSLCLPTERSTAFKEVVLLGFREMTRLLTMNYKAQ